MHAYDRTNSDRKRSLMVAISGLAVLRLYSGVADAAEDTHALGRHLANECAACHVQAPVQPGAGPSIPPLAGKPAAEFIAIMQDFKSGKRTNTTMVSVAQSLSDTEIAALAAYFAILSPGGPGSSGR